MKETSLVLTGLLVLSSASIAYAANNDTGSQGTSQAVSSPTMQVQQKPVYASPSPTGMQVQNQVKTQNAGEESQLQVKTQEQESQGDSQGGQGTPKDGSPRNEMAQEKMSTVANKVDELLMIKTTQGGIGEQVKKLAQAQKQAQVEIEGELDKVNGRGNLIKALIGPNYGALKNAEKIMEQNQLRIKELSQLQIQLTSQADITLVQATIQALTEQNTALQDQVVLETQSKSMFGWLFKLFAK